jgi:hypothetical protein
LDLLENSEIKRQPIGNHGSKKKIQVVEINWNMDASYHVVKPEGSSCLAWVK